MQSLRWSTAEKYSQLWRWDENNSWSYLAGRYLVFRTDKPLHTFICLSDGVSEMYEMERDAYVSSLQN